MQEGDPVTSEESVPLKRMNRRKTMSELAGMIADNPVTDPDDISALREMGMADEDMCNATVIVSSIFHEAKNGDMKAVAAWQQLLESQGDGKKEFDLPAKVLAKSFVDLNREIVPGIRYVLKGGRGSTKSSFVSLKFIELLINHPNIHGCAIRKHSNTLKDSVFAQLKWAISTLGLEQDFKYKVSPMEITYLPTGQVIYFRGCDDSGKLKSLKPPFGYLGILWLEEADQLEGAFEMRSIRQSILRGGDDSFFFMSYNPPRSSQAWVNQELRVPDTNRVVHSSSYLDVPPSWLGKTFIEEAEHLKEVNPVCYEHEYLGAANGTSGNVFEFIEMQDITDEDVARFDTVFAGLDFGWDPDPNVFIVIGYDQRKEKLYILDEYVSKRQRNHELAQAILDKWGERLGDITFGIQCDWAREEKTIFDLVDLGVWNAKAVPKPAGSVAYGMKWLARRTIVIDPNRTPFAAKEFVQYEFERDKEGNILSGYVDKDNHSIDAARYAMSPLILSRMVQN